MRNEDVKRCTRVMNILCIVRWNSAYQKSERGNKRLRSLRRSQRRQTIKPEEKQDARELRGEDRRRVDLRLVVEAETLEDQNLASLGRHGLALSEKHPDGKGKQHQR